MHVRRTLVTVALAAVFAMTAAPAGAVTPVAGVGTVGCHVGGGFTFKPALVAGGTVATTVTFHTALKTCTGTGDAVNVIGGTSKVVKSLPTNDCQTVLQSADASQPQSGVLKWRVLRGTTPLVPSTITFTSGTADTGPPITADATGSSTAGSFLGDAATAHLQLKQTVSTITARCLSTTGLTGLTFDPTASTFTLG